MVYRVWQQLLYKSPNSLTFRHRFPVSLRGFTCKREQTPSRRIAAVAVVAIEKWLVVGFGRGTVSEASLCSKLVPVDLTLH